jgi:hypothetical protein
MCRRRRFLDQVTDMQQALDLCRWNEFVTVDGAPFVQGDPPKKHEPL